MRVVAPTAMEWRAVAWGATGESPASAVAALVGAGGGTPVPPVRPGGAGLGVAAYIIRPERAGDHTVTFVAGAT